MNKVNLFNYLKTHISILEVVGQYATLKKAGLYWKGKCPFHTEKTGSFTVSPHKEIFYCFGCHIGGDAISFVARIENCSQLEAAKFLIDRYQIDVPTTLGNEYKSPSDGTKRYYQICEYIAQWCHTQLMNCPQALAYLGRRSIDQKSINNFMIGYFPGGLANVKRMITDFAKHQILVDELLEIHVLSRTKNILFSPFEERILFPITDHLGRFCGFGGRTYKSSDTRAKYYNSHENDHFAKGHLLFGLDKAKKDLQKKGIVFLVEGYLDCITMAAHGYSNTVATLGTACSLDHLNTLARYVNQIFIVYDGDQAGRQALIRIGQLCWQASIELKVINLPPNEDPASYLSGGNSLEPLIEKAQDIFEFFIQEMGADFKDKPLAQKLQLTRTILEMITKLEDPIKQDILLSNASHALAIPFDSLKKEIKRTITPAPKPEQARGTAPKKIYTKTPAINTLENKIFFGIMNNIQLINTENEEFLITYLPHPLCDILKKLQEEKKVNPALGFLQFFELLEASTQQLVSKTILECQEDISAPLFEQLLIQLQKKHWKLIVSTIKIKLEIAKQKGNDAEIAQIMQNFMDLKKKIIGNMLCPVGGLL